MNQRILNDVLIWGLKTNLQLKSKNDKNKQNAFFNFYDQWGVLAIFLGGFTPIPYKVIAITSGYAKFNFFSFILLSALSRGMRFLIIGFIIKRFGDLGIIYLQKYTTKKL